MGLEQFSSFQPFSIHLYTKPPPLPGLHNATWFFVIPTHSSPITQSASGLCCVMWRGEVKAFGEAERKEPGQICVVAKRRLAEFD